MGTANIGLVNTQRFDVDLLPYDAEVEYLYIDGSLPHTMYPHINTGIIPTIETSCEIKCMSTTFVGWGGILGSSTTDGSPDTFYLRKNGNSANNGYCCWIDGKYYNQILMDEGNIALCRLSKTVFEVNNSSVSLNAVSYTTVPTLPMFLFSINLNGSPWAGRPFKGRIYYCKIWNNNILVRDFIPIRFTNELNQPEGAMYDRVSKQLFRNQGTRNFSYGNDKQGNQS